MIQIVSGYFKGYENIQKVLTKKPCIIVISIFLPALFLIPFWLFVFKNFWAFNDQGPIALLIFFILLYFFLVWTFWKYLSTRSKKKKF